MEMKTKTGQMVKDHGLRKISHLMRERTHFPQKYASMMSCTWGAVCPYEKEEDHDDPHISTDVAET